MMIMVGGGGRIADLGVFVHTFKRFVDSGTIGSSLREERTGRVQRVTHCSCTTFVWWGKEGLVVGDWRCRAVTADGWSPLSINTRGLYPPHRTVPSFTVLFSPCLRRHGNPPRVYTVVANKNTPSPPPPRPLHQRLIRIVPCEIFSTFYCVGVGFFSKNTDVFFKDTKSFTKNTIHNLFSKKYYV